LNLGIFNKKKVFIQYTAVKENLENEIKKITKIFKYFGKNTSTKNASNINTTNNLNLSDNSNSNINQNNTRNINNFKNYFNEEDYTIDEIYKKSDVFGENIFGMINFFSFKKEEKKINHIFEGLNIGNLIINQNNDLQKEYYFENFSRFFKKIENYCIKGEIPHDFDIFTTKHSNSKSFDVLINVFTKKETFTGADMESCNIKIYKKFNLTQKSFFNY